MALKKESTNICHSSSGVHVQSQLWKLNSEQVNNNDTSTT